MSIALFAILGAKLGAGVGYWICFGIYCGCQLIKAINEMEK